MFRATRAADGLTVAVKEIPLRWSDPDKTRELIAREARVLSELSHPQIPALIEDFVVGTGRNRAACIVQQFVPGEDLQSAPRRRSVDEVLDIVAELLPVLRYLHTRSPPVIHRDIKPGNVIRTPDGQLVLVDFGAVRDALRDQQLGGSTVAGTFGYMAPEQFAGDASPATDLYGLGALAIALLTRRDPQTMVDHRRALQWRGHAQVPGPVADFLDRLVAPDPKLRPASADAAARQLQTARRAGHAPTARAPARPLAPPLRLADAQPAGFPAPELFEPPQRVSQGTQLRRTVGGFALGGLLSLVVGVGVLVVLLFVRAPEPLPPPVPTPPAVAPPAGVPFAELYQVAAACSFDNCRQDIAQSLVSRGEPMTVAEAHQLGALCSFDACREVVLADVYPRLAVDAPGAGDVRALAEQCSFDACRESVLIANYPNVSDPERYVTILDVFSFDTGRVAVRRKLGL